MHSKLILGLFAAALLASCSDDDDDDGGGPVPGQAAADIVIGDAPADDLLAFFAEVQSVRVRRLDTTFTDNLMTSGAVEVEFLGLEDTRKLLTRVILDEDTYDAIEIGFAPGTYAAMTEDGSPVTVTSTGDTILVPFQSDFVVDTDEYVRMVVDLNLDDALEGDLGAGTATFTPDATAVVETAGVDLPIDELKGLVTAENEAGGEFTVSGFADDEQLVALGPVFVTILPTTLFLDETGTQLDSTEFFTAVTANQTFVEISGSLSTDGDLVADRVEIEDQTGGGSDLVRIEGTILEVGLGTFMLRVIQVEDGGAIADPILDGIGSSDIEVAHDVDTVFVIGRDELSDSTSLVLGRRVKVEFCTFATEPFPACIVDVQGGEPEFDGVLTDVTGVPDDVVARMDAGELAIASGAVQDENTDVTVVITGSSLTLDVEGEPAIITTDLVAGLETEIEGDFTGLPATPTLTATRVRVKPGFLDDTLATLADEPNSRFLTTGGDIVDSFGPNVTAGAQEVLIQPGATFSGDVASAAELFDLLATAAGATALIDVYGLGTDVANQIRAFHIDVRVP